MTTIFCRNTFSAVRTAALLSLLFILAACSARQQSTATSPAPNPLSPEAELNYDYLLYQDQLQQLQKHASMGKASPLTQADVAAITARAEGALDNLLQADPTPQLYLEKAGLHWNDPNGTAVARDILRKGLGAFPDDRMLTIYMANSYAMDNQVDAAIDVMDDYLGRHKDDYEATERTGQMLMDADRNTQALDMLKRIPPEKRSPDALYTMGRVQAELGMRKAAIANLKRAVEKDPGFTEALVELAYQYELAKDYIAAEKIYGRILDQEAFPEARLRMVNLNLKLNNPAKALQIALDGPHTKSFILDATLMFVNEHFYAQGSTVLDMLAVGGQIPAEYYFYKAVIADEGEKDLQKALGYLDKVDPKDKLYPHALRFKAQIYNAEGDTAKALSIAEEGKKLFPEGAIFYILESSLRAGEKDLAGAEAALREGLKVLPGNPQLTYELAMLLDSSDRRAEGLEMMEQVIRSHPDNANALNYVGYTLAEEGKDLQRALVLVEKAAALDPESGFILDSVAWVHFHMKNYDKAWENIGYAVEIVDNDPTLWEHYGDIAKAMGKTREARKGYNYALKFKTPRPKAIRAKLKSL
ncbi:tetratricopeptide repeat protein [Pseudodesulfovibrio sp.]|uniref:tetratricopeptide repeat protein n=1 Tax=unclassified Pseudodesulfovibrio TaxID=2661612 RepID=UPI003B006D46